MKTQYATQQEMHTPAAEQQAPRSVDASPQEPFPGTTPVAEPQALGAEDALSVAQGEVTLLQSQLADMQDQLLRSQAEAHNVRRRAQEDISKTRKFAIEAFAENLLPVVDSLEAGLAVKEASLEQIQQGAQATLQQLKAALERNKVLELNPGVGSAFDPHYHQAISVAEAPPGSVQGPNTIVAVLQKGYQLAERVLRPALVTVTAS